jgi:hypothetical protein
MSTFSTNSDAIYPRPHSSDEALAGVRIAPGAITAFAPILVRSPTRAPNLVTPVSGG